MDYALPEQPDKVKYTFFLLSAEQGLAYERSPLAKTGTKFWPKWCQGRSGGPGKDPHVADEFREQHCAVCLSKMSGGRQKDRP